MALKLQVAASMMVFMFSLLIALSAKLLGLHLFLIISSTGYFVLAVFILCMIIIV
jgi:hypothetical protein